MPTKPNANVNLPYPDFDNSGAPETPAQQMISVDEDAAAIEEGSGRIRVEYTDVINNEELPPLRMKLGQPGTPEVKDHQAKAGQFLVSGFPPFDSVTVVPLRWGRSRDYAVGRPLISLCTSTNGKIGIGDNGTEPGKVGRHDCATCPKNVWRKNPNPNVKTNLPPECSEQYNFVFFVAELGMPVEYRFQKTGLKVGSDIIRVCQAQGWGGFATRLTALFKTSPASPEGFEIPVSTYVPEPDPRKDPEGYERHQAILKTAQAMLKVATRPADPAE